MFLQLERILVGLDGSPREKHVLEVAQGLARRWLAHWL